MTSNSSNKKRYGAPVKFVFSFSLAFLMAWCFAKGESWGNWDQQWRKATTADAQRKVLEGLRLSSLVSDAEFADIVAQTLEKDPLRPTDIKRISLALRLRKEFLDPKPSASSDRNKEPKSAKTKVDKALEGEAYVPLNKGKSSSNWMEKGLKGLGDFLERMLSRNKNAEERPSQVGGGYTPNMAIIFRIIWFVLGAIFLGFLIFALTKFRLGDRLDRRKRVGLLEPGEELLTADEWLTKADAMERTGDYRGAVRCLYLASLIRLDEAGVARFIPSQTNWEHQRRIESSPKPMPSIGFRPMTARFDEVWYGNSTASAEDAANFRATYQAILDAKQGALSA